MSEPVKPRAAISWSGGKDSCTAFELARQDFDVVVALTMIDEEERRSRSHGIRVELLREQTAAMGIAHVMRPCDWPSYEKEFAEGLRELRSHDVSHVIFGDIVYPEHREWAERLASEAGLVAVEPLWGRATADVVNTFLTFGGRALIVTVNAKFLDQSWLGVELTPVTVDRLVQLGVDACGENGEYHTFVVNAPGFARPVEVALGEVVGVRGTWAVDLSLLPPATARGGTQRL
jgi:diphthine-ammonia ligase